MRRRQLGKTAYLDAVGPNADIRSVLRAQGRQWAVTRQWRDFLWRGHGDTVFRSKNNRLLTVAILGYLGLKQMEEIGKPCHLPFPESNSEKPREAPDATTQTRS